MSSRSIDLPVFVEPQPDYTTCGPTCLQAVYRFHGLQVPLERVIREIPALATGGTLAVNLACHALRSGFRTTIFTYNLQLFDPTWFAPGADIAAKVEAQMQQKTDLALRSASETYLEYFRLGGRLLFEELTPELIQGYLDARTPILTGLSATYLYGAVRERGLLEDDVQGEPVGHFVIACGYDAAGSEVLVSDPHHDNPRFRVSHYRVGMSRFIGSILLGILTHDANILVVEPALQS